MFLHIFVNIINFNLGCFLPCLSLSISELTLALLYNFLGSQSRVFLSGLPCTSQFNFLSLPHPLSLSLSLPQPFLSHYLLSLSPFPTPFFSSLSPSLSPFPTSLSLSSFPTPFFILSLSPSLSIKFLNYLALMSL